MVFGRAVARAKEGGRLFSVCVCSGFSSGCTSCSCRLRERGDHKENILTLIYRNFLNLSESVHPSEVTDGVGARSGKTGAVHDGVLVIAVYCNKIDARTSESSEFLFRLK